MEATTRKPRAEMQNIEAKTRQPRAEIQKMKVKMGQVRKQSQARKQSREVPPMRRTMAPRRTPRIP